MEEIRIVESYRDYQPPFDVAKDVRRLLNTVPEKYLKDLDCILMRNQGSLPRRDRKRKVWGRRQKVELSEVAGLYHHAGSHKNRPYVELRIDKILAGLPRTLVWIPFVRRFAVGSVLFHEIGHHIHSTIRPEYDDKEDVADKWGKKLGSNFMRKEYWYAMWPLVLFGKIKRRLSQPNARVT